MKKLKLMSIALATSFFIYNCDTKKQEGNSDNSNMTEQDGKEVAEEANEEKTETDSAEDKAEFAVDAADDGMFEVEAAKLARQKASDQRVRDFANMMETQHTKANTELKALAATKNITLPTSLSEDKKKKMEKLNEKNGADFDKEYVDIMVKAHKKAVDLFEDESERSEQGEVQAWAAKTLPVLKQHHEHAEKLQDDIKK